MDSFLGVRSVPGEQQQLRGPFADQRDGIPLQRPVPSGSLLTLGRMQLQNIGFARS